MEKVLDDKAGVKIGEVVLTIDGAPVEKRCEFLSRFIAASTPQAADYAAASGILSGQKDTVAKLTIRNREGKIRTVEIARSLSKRDPKIFAAIQRQTPVVQVLPSGFGYVDLARLPLAEVDKMFETIKNTPAVIFDMRGYPNGTAWAIAPRLTEKKTPVAALFSNPIVEATDISSDWKDAPLYIFSQKLPER